MAPALLDTNVLVYAAYGRSRLHEAATELLRQALSVRGLYCIAPQNLVEFGAVVSRSRLVTDSMSAQDIRRFGATLFRSRKLLKIYPRRATVSRAIREAAGIHITGAAWYDLFLAVTMRDAGVNVIVTEDSVYNTLPFVTAVRIADALQNNTVHRAPSHTM